LGLAYEHEIGMPERNPKRIPWLLLSFGIIITGISGTRGAHIYANSVRMSFVWQLVEASLWIRQTKRLGIILNIRISA
jgi:hypothetical protein